MMGKRTSHRHCWKGHAQYRDGVSLAICRCYELRLFLSPGEQALWLTALILLMVEPDNVLYNNEGEFYQAWMYSMLEGR